MQETPAIVMIPADAMQEIFTGILLKYGFTQLRAFECATIFPDSSLDGIYTHEVDRRHRTMEW